MPLGRPKLALALTDDARRQLESIARSRSVPAALNQRAKIVLACAAGTSNSNVPRNFVHRAPPSGNGVVDSSRSALSVSTMNYGLARHGRYLTSRSQC